MAGLDVLEQPLDQRAVEVVAPEMGIPVRRQHLEDAVLHAQDGDIERAAPEVVNREDSLGQAFQAIGERGRGRLVHDAQHVEPGDATGVLRRLPLGVVEVGGHRDHRLLDRLPEESLGRRP